VAARFSLSPFFSTISFFFAATLWPRTTGDLTETSNCELPADVAELLELGSFLGQSQAFGLVAGRRSAAQAASLKRLRDEKKYKRVKEHWCD
jgi:hypothetical protein